MKKISLRALEPSDVDLLYKWENDRSIWTLSNTVSPFSRFVLEQYVMNSHIDIYTTKQLRLMIELADTGKTIGAIDLFEFDPHNRRVGVGIFISDEERDKGYASSTLDLIINYCFNTLMVHQIFCNISADNKKSHFLFKNKGFKLIGVKKEWLLVENKWMDEFIFQLINIRNTN